MRLLKISLQPENRRYCPRGWDMWHQKPSPPCAQQRLRIHHNSRFNFQGTETEKDLRLHTLLVISHFQQHGQCSESESHQTRVGNWVQSYHTKSPATFFCPMDGWNTLRGVWNRHFLLLFQVHIANLEPCYSVCSTDAWNLLQMHNTGSQPRPTVSERML